MRELLESVSQLMKHYTGSTIDPFWMPHLAVGLTLVFSAAGLYRWTRRQMGDMRALSSELSAATQVIAKDAEPKFEKLLTDFSSLHAQLQRDIGQRLDTLQIDLRSINSVDSRPADADVESETADGGPSKQTRLRWAQNVRSAVLERWLAGGFFTPTKDDRNCFEYEAVGPTGELIYFHLQTPYRSKFMMDDRLSYTLEVWVGKYKKLNFEWDNDGNYALRGFKKGDWLEDVANWNITPAMSKAGRKSA